MPLSIAALPLRTTNANQDLHGMLGKWIDTHGVYQVQDCDPDLTRMGQLRQRIAQHLVDYDSGAEILEEIHQYYHALLDCERKGIASATGADEEDANSAIALEWKSKLTGKRQVGYSIPWERANIAWNLAAIGVHQAVCQPSDKNGWNNACKHFQQAASWLEQLANIQSSFYSCKDFSPSYLSFWKTLFLAESQRCAFHSLLCAPRPKHLTQAKLAAAAHPIYKSVGKLFEQYKRLPTAFYGYAYPASWEDYRAAFISYREYMKCMAQYHQALSCGEKRQLGEELLRLDLAHKIACECSPYCENSTLVPLQELYNSISAILVDIKQRMSEAQNTQPVPKGRQLAPIPELTVARIETLTKILRVQGEPFFRGTLGDAVPATKQIAHLPSQGVEVAVKMPSRTSGVPTTTLQVPDRHITEPSGQALQQHQHIDLSRFVTLFRTEMKEDLHKMIHSTQERTESARKALATVNLPHSLTAYQQELRGGGIPNDLWRRVETIQRDGRIAKLKQELWQLRETAETARNGYEHVKRQLDLDLQSDQTFRNENQGYLGRDINQVQSSFRKHLAKYDKLLVNAQEGDSVLLRRLEVLDTNPKYKLLTFEKAQLDNLLPGASNDASMIDVSRLSKLLVELNKLLQEREKSLASIQEAIQKFDIEKELRTKVINPITATDRTYEGVVKEARKQFDESFAHINRNMEQQSHLVNRILAENKIFMIARQHQSNNFKSSDSCIVMIEEAIEELDELSKHLEDGSVFYSAFTPKMEKLRNKVDDLSARLAAERLEYYDTEGRQRQEEADALMARRLSIGGNNLPSSNTSGVAHGHPDSVDDQAVATLVDMGYEPAKVVAALKRHGNNIDDALNDLLNS